VTVLQNARQGQLVAVRAAVLDLAVGLVAHEGVGALSMRRLANAAGCSTTVVYSAFGNKAGLADALFAEGFARFRARLDRVPADLDPLDRLIALRDAYRDNALANPHYYQVMFGAVIPDFVPSADALQAAHATLEVLVDQVAACVAAGVFSQATDPVAAAEALWVAVHGAVSLELSGHLDPETAAARFAEVADAVGASYLNQEGST
jgi:AcrR family transcriptional regulator